jgi:peptide/nickel transport system substrate-binding protein
MKRTRLLALLAVIAMIIAACGGGDSDSTTTTADDGGQGETTTTAVDTTEPTDPPAGGGAGEGGDLVILQWQAPSQVNTMLSSGTKDFFAGSLVLEPLAEIDPVGNLVPALAAEIPTVENGGVAEDFTSITWTLKEGVLWSDGTPFTADDVLFSYEYCSDELTGCQADFSTIAEVVVVDDLTVTFNFTNPKPYPYDDFVTGLEPVIQRAQFADCVGEGASACTDQNFHPVGTGPYIVTDISPEDFVSYEMNPNYRGIPDGKPSFGTVTIQGGGDAESTARSVLEIGEADYAWNLQVAPEILGPMEAAGNGVVVTSFTANVEHINLNQTDPDGDPPSEHPSQHPVLYNNPEFSRALSLAIDRDSLVAVGYGPTGVPTCTMWPVGDQQSTNNDWCLTRNVEEANTILDGLGYTDTDGDGIREHPTFGPLVFDFVTSTNAVRQSNQDIIKANWEEIGIGTNMSNQDASLFFDGTSASDFSIWKFFADMEMFTNGATLPDPAAYLFSWTQGEIPTAALGWPASGNIPRMQSAEYDATWEQLQQTAPGAEGYNDLVIQLQDQMAANGSIIPLIHRGNVSAIKSDIEGLGEPNGWDSEYWIIEEWHRVDG